jgi:dTDP-4-amino-4,6-dideoxygalactose transaminase
MKHEERELINADKYADCLLRLPFYFELTEQDVYFISEKIKSFMRY